MPLLFLNIKNILIIKLFMLKYASGVVMKGIILTAGNAKRLRPITDCFGKVLVPIYDKPMIFYGLSIMAKLGIREVAIVCNERDFKTYKELLVNRYNNFDIKLFVQKEALGTAHAINYASDFIGDDDFTLLFGDNIFVMKNIEDYLIKAKHENEEITLFAKEVLDPERFGVIESDKDNNIISIEEKPEKPKTNLASTGLYICSNSVKQKLKNVKLSLRGEYEFTDVISLCVKEGKAKVCVLPKSCSWLDTGTFDSLLECSILVKEFEKNNGLYACIELDLLNQNIISKNEFNSLIEHYSSDYKNRILNSLKLI